MPNENIFGEATPSPTPTPTETPAGVDPVVSILSEIVGDDGQQKYKDVTTALNALKHSQEYIKQMKAQLDEASLKASQAVTMEQVLAAVNKPTEAPTPPTAPPAGLTADDVVRILQEKEKAERQKTNAAKVAQRFKETHGEKAEEAFYGKAAEMGLTRDSINQLAATSPEAVFSMFGMKGGTVPAPPPPSGINTGGMQTPTPSPLGSVMGFKTDRDLAEYWSKLKAEVNSSLGIK